MKTQILRSIRTVTLLAGLLGLLAISIPSARAVPDCPECAKLNDSRGNKPSIPESGQPAVNGQCASGLAMDAQGNCVKASATKAE